MSVLTRQQQHITSDPGDLISPKKRKRGEATGDLAKLLLRLSIGGLLTGHGAQKLFGWFGGPGLKGTAALMGMLGLEEQPWGTLAGLSEFGGGALTSLGLLHPLGPIATLGAMGVAAGKVHKGKPIWATEGGAELSVLYMAAAVALSLDDPGRLSLDRLFGIRVPKAISLLAMAGVVASVVFVIQKEPAQAAPSDQQKPQA